MDYRDVKTEPSRSLVQHASYLERQELPKLKGLQRYNMQRKIDKLRIRAVELELLPNQRREAA